MTFLEGLLSFLSPCMLPMLPVYLIYFAGGEGGSRSRTVVNAVAFALGFSCVFIALGVFAGTLGAALAAHRTAVSVVCAAVLVLLGFLMAADIPLPLKGMKGAKPVGGIVSAFVFGLTFSLALTPCVGAFLGAALVTAASEGGAAKGALLLTEYSLGLAIPFILSALMINKLKTVFTFFKVHARGVSAAAGVMLMVLGCYDGYRALGKSAPTAEAVAETPQADPKVSKEEKKMEITLNAANFEAEVLKADLPVIVDFWATWCGPCRMLAPELEALAAEKAGVVKVGKVNVDENPELCAKYGITSIPAVFVFKGGKIAAQSVGYCKKDDLLRLLEK